MSLRIPSLLLLTFLVSACQVLEQRWEAEEVPETETMEEAETPTDMLGRLPRAIAHLQDGEIERAEMLLTELVDDNPGHRLAVRLLRQLHEEPESLLGNKFMQVVVEPGDTLSEIAERHAGDGMLFVALARLNNIEQPRLLRPGAVLRVPVTVESPVEEGESAVSVAESLLAEGDPEQAISLMMSITRDGELDEREQSLLARSAVDVTGRHLAEGRIDQAGATLDRLESWQASLAEDAAFARQRDRIDAHIALGEAGQAAAANDRQAEREWLLRALELDPDLAVAASALEASTLVLVDRYHELALKAWRAHEVGDAVAYWERVLEFDPDFEPAQVYLERAREVQRRLEEL